MRLLITLMLMSPAAAAHPPNVVLTEAERGAALDSEIASEAFQARLDVVSRSERYPGNQALILMNGKMSFPVRYQLIDNAQNSIVLSTFSLFAGEQDGQIKDPSTRLLIEKLIAAKQRGVNVKVITDGFSSVLTGANSAIKALREVGITVVKYNPVVHQDFELKWFAALPHFLYRFAVMQNPTTNRWHEKTLIVDGRYAIIGGLNWGEHYKDGNNFSSSRNDVAAFYEHPLIREIGVTAQTSWGSSDPDSWRDTDILIKGPVVFAALEQLLLDLSILEIISDKRRRDQYMHASEQDFAEARQLVADRYLDNASFFPAPLNPAASGGMQARYVSQRPFLDRRRENRIAELRVFAEQNDVYVHPKNPMLGISNLYINLINKAKKQILWGCHSNRPTDDVMQALVAAAGRGVQIYLIGNSRASAKTLPGNGRLMYGKAYRRYKNLLMLGNGNIRLFEWRREIQTGDQTIRSGAFHSKVFSVDGVISSIGPYNVSKASFGKHTEGTMVVIDPAFARSTEQMFQDDLGFSEEVTLANISAEQQQRRRRELARSHHQLYGPSH